jgi:serine/threonine-protein kinase
MTDATLDDIARRLRLALGDRYEIGQPLGEGGMALVFEATDVRHRRRVAVKVLRPELSAQLGPDRFLQEIQVTANLQHPHILPLYDSGAADDLLYYVMPLVQGGSLRDRLHQEHELSVADAVALITALASALDYAHRQGILHRDIKPENILLHDGQPMLSDFGIALAVSAAGTKRMTQTGLSIGTPTYMSPEQMSGERTPDGRSDLYSLACVGYEALAGQPPFVGASMQAVVAAVLVSKPQPLNAVRPLVSPAVAAAIHRALSPLPADRFATGADFVAALGDQRLGRLPSDTARKTPLIQRLGWLTAAAVVGGVIGLLGARPHPSPAGATVRRWNVVLPDSLPVALPGGTMTAGPHPTIALSPAGDRLAYITNQHGASMLALRDMTDGTSTVLAGTEGAYHPFFSPDGQWLGFFAGDVLRKVAVAGGAPVTVAPVNRMSGALWTSADQIMVLQNEGFDLHWISATTGVDSVVRLGVQFGTPAELPGHEWVVGQFGSSQMALLSLKTGEQLAITRRGVLPLDSVRKEDLLFGSSPQWLPSGYLLYGAGDGLLMAMPFDGTRRQMTGEPFSVLSGMRIEAGFGYAEYAVGSDGTLVYAPGGNQLYVNIAFVGADGHVDTLPFPRAAYTQPRLSPNGTTLAVQARSDFGGWETLLMNLSTGVERKVEVTGNYRTYPASWLPNGRELMIGLWDPVRFINHGVRIQSIETGQFRDIQMPGAAYLSVSPDGSRLVFNDWITGEIFLQSMTSDTARTPVRARGYSSSFSRDGRWIAWSGVDGSVGVSSVPPTGAIYTVTDQGNMPVWTPDGTALIYRNAGRYYRVPISTSNGFHAGRATLFAEGPFLSTFAWNHDIAKDGRLLVLLNSPTQTVTSLGVITSIGDAVAMTQRSR